MLARVEKFEESVLDSYKINNIIIDTFQRVLGRQPSVVELDKYNDITNKLIKAKHLKDYKDITKNLEFEIRKREERDVTIEDFEEDDSDNKDIVDVDTPPKSANAETFQEALKAKKAIDNLIDSLLHR